MIDSSRSVAHAYAPAMGDNHRSQSFSVRLAQRITDTAGSMPFVWAHVVWFSLWIIANSGVLEPLVTPWDPFPYGLLTMIVSLEAIFLSLFCLIAQNAGEARAQQRQQDDQMVLRMQLDAISARLDSLLSHYNDSNSFHH